MFVVDHIKLQKVEKYRALQIGKRQYPFDLRKYCREFHTVQQAHTAQSIWLTTETKKLSAETCIHLLITSHSNLRYSSDSIVADAIFTNVKECGLLVQTADCLCVYVHLQRVDSPAKAWVGLIHAGWRGLKQQIVAKTIQKLLQTIGPYHIILTIAFGAHARSCCYEVGGEFEKYFDESCLVKRAGRLYLDMLGVAKLQIEQVWRQWRQEINNKSFLQYSSNEAHCTMCMPNNYYSHRMITANKDSRKNLNRQSKPIDCSLSASKNKEGRNLHIIYLK